MSLPNLTDLTICELLSVHNNVLDRLMSLDVIGSQNNPTGDYTEWLVSTKLGLIRATNSAKGYDATDSAGLRYQIKGRRVTPSNKSKQLSVIRCLEDRGFDFLVAVVFNANWQVQSAAKIPHHSVAALSTYRESVNGRIMHLRSSVFDDGEIMDITRLLSDQETHVALTP